MVQRRKTVVWVLRWEVAPCGPAPGVTDGEIVGILDGRWGAKRICDAMLMLFAERMYSAAEKLEYRGPDRGPYLPGPIHRVHGVAVSELAYACGHNPFLVAVRAENCQSIGSEGLEWEELGPVHSAWLCASLGFADCPLAGKDRQRLRYRWTPAQGLEREASASDS